MARVYRGVGGSWVGGFVSAKDNSSVGYACVKIVSALAYDYKVVAVSGGNMYYAGAGEVSHTTDN